MYPRCRKTLGVLLAARALWFGQRMLRCLGDDAEQRIGTSRGNRNEVSVVGNRYRDLWLTTDSSLAGRL